jgi:copper(I)-binding protein
MSSRLLGLTAGLVIALIFTIDAWAQTGGVEIKDAWARATPGGADIAGVYLTIVSPIADRLVGVSSPASQKAELHQMTMDGGVMKMRQVDAIDLPAGQTVTMKPGGYHIMLTGLTQPLKEGQTFAMTLSFDKAGSREVTVTVRKVGAMGPQGQPGTGMTMPMPGMHH